MKREDSALSKSIRIRMRSLKALQKKEVTR